MGRSSAPVLVDVKRLGTGFIVFDAKNGEKSGLHAQFGYLRVGLTFKMKRNEKIIQSKHTGSVADLLPSQQPVHD